MIEPKVTSTIANLENLKVKPGPFLSKVDSVAKDLNLVEVEDVKDIRDSFLDNLVANIKLRL